MIKKRTIELVGQIATSEQAMHDEVEYYASISWRESAATSESLRKMIWDKEYKEGMDRSIAGTSRLNQDRDDIE